MPQPELINQSLTTRVQVDRPHMTTTLTGNPVPDHGRLTVPIPATEVANGTGMDVVVVPVARPNQMPPGPEYRSLITAPVAMGLGQSIMGAARPARARASQAVISAVFTGALPG